MPEPGCTVQMNRNIQTTTRVGKQNFYLIMMDTRRWLCFSSSYMQREINELH